MLVYFVRRRRDVPFSHLFWLFGLFILGCGTTHLMEVIVSYQPLYWLAALIKIVTAVASWGTVFALLPVTPKALAMRSPEDLERRVKERTAELECVNDALRESEAKFRRIVETANEGVWQLDVEGRITFVNARMAEMLGYRPEEMVGRQKWDFLFDEDKTKMQALFERRRAGISEHADIRFRHRDGRELWAILSARPVLDPQGRFLGALDMFTDVTVRRQAEDALKEADRRKDQFLAMLAHELRNPLAPIRNALQVLRLAAPSDPTLDEARGMIERQVSHMARLVDDLLDVSRISRGKILLRKEPLDLTELVRAAAEDHRLLMEGHGLHLDVRLPDRPLWVDGDPTRLAQALGNLLQNAGKFTEPGGGVSVELQVDAAGRQALVAVRDTGIGMTPEMLARAFESFAKADQSLARNRGGLGLGLALVKGLVELHGGSVSAASPGPSLGSTFTIRLPLTEAPAPAPRPPAAVPEANGRRLNVLVVEDNLDSAQSLKILLELLGHQVTVAYTGPAGVEAARAERPDLVLCDIGLPGGMDGYGVARALRQDSGLCGTYLIALTGYGQEQDQRQAREAGFDRHMTKPVDLPELRRLLAARAAMA